MLDRYTKAVLTIIAATLVALVAQRFTPTATAQVGPPSLFTLVAGSGGNSAWVLNTSTGAVRYCLPVGFGTIGGACNGVSN